MSTRHALATVCLLFVAVPAFAQSNKWDLFGGYQFAHFHRMDSRSDTPFAVEPGVSGSGWNAALTRHFNDWLGVKADFSGAYLFDHTADPQNQSHVHMLTYTFGPVFTTPNAHRTSAFAEVLFGGYHQSALGSSNGAAMTLGLGVDERITDRMALRLFDFDWIGYLSNNIGSFGAAGNAPNPKGNVRLSAGIVFRF